MMRRRTEKELESLDMSASNITELEAGSDIESYVKNSGYTIGYNGSASIVIGC